MQRLTVIVTRGERRVPRRGRTSSTRCERALTASWCRTGWIGECAARCTMTRSTASRTSAWASFQGLQINTWGTDPDGEMWIGTFDGSVYKIVPER